MKSFHIRTDVVLGCFLLMFSLVGCAQSVQQASASQSPRERTLINTGWRFTKNDPDGTGDKFAYQNVKTWMLSTGVDFVKDPDAARQARPQGNLGQDVAYTTPEFNDGQWRSLNLPHDWGIEGPFQLEAPGATGKLPYYGIAWYRKHLNIPASDQGKQIYLDIDGAMSYANVWINGQYAGGWGNGYTSFRVDLTPFVKPGGDNVVAIRLDNPDRSSRFYCGGGIYRNVWLVKTSPVHVGQYGTYITTPEVSADKATVDVKATIDNRSADPVDVIVQTSIHPIRNAGDPPTSEKPIITDPVSVRIAPGKSETASSKVSFSSPKLWSIKSPNRYTAITTVSQNGKVIDSYETPFGIRTITFDASKGFFLNGEQIGIKGVCNHSDLGALGMAINIRAMQRQLEILRVMGCNAIRTSHNFPAPELVELCDKMGFVMIDEAFDTWEGQKTPNDYHLLFGDWSERDLRSNIRRDRNSPSVIAWSTGNEVGEVGRGASPTSIRLTRIATEEDPTRPTIVAAHNYQAAFNGFQNTIGIFGYNYLRAAADNTAMYKEFHAANPNKFVVSTESASTLSSRGVYVFPFTNVKGGGFSSTEQQMSSYDIYAPPWASTPDMEWKAEDSAGFVVGGEFVWTGFDYLGEPTVTGAGGGTSGAGRIGRGPVPAPASGPTPAPTTAARGARRGGGEAAAPNPRRSSYFGIIDLAGFPKDRFYLYQSRWLPDVPMAHILPHWNWADRVGELTPVHVYTSGDEGELFLNGKSLGKKKKGEYEYRLRWDEVKYEPGELKVVTYKAGKPWADAVMKTTGPAAKVTLKPDRNRITADGDDLSFVTVSIADKDGQMVPRSMNMLKFEITGPGEIIAVDNGDPTSLESFQTTQMKAFNGLCLVIVRSKPGQAGRITLKAVSEGLGGGETNITVAR